MDILKDKSYKQYSYVSRYSRFPYYYNTLDRKYMYGITSQLSKDTVYVIHKVKYSDTLDSLALQYYGSPDYFWIIAYFNNVQDSFMRLSDKFETIKIPSLTNISFED